MSDPIFVTTSGPVRGEAREGVFAFRGLPYAAAPVGPLRFKEARPAVWSDVRDATQPGPTYPQILRDFDALDLKSVVGEGWRKGDDYLNVSIWTSDPAALGMPVMVFIHGGGFVAGCNDAPVLEGWAFAKRDVVFMSINYRMGIDGFLPVEGAPTNLGLRDQIAALQWIKANAAAFGGDPDNVTVFGESAGAMCIADLVASPLAKGLFRRAIIQSGHGEMVRTLPVARRLTRKLAKLLKIKPDVDGFNSRPMEEQLKALEKVQQPFPNLDLREKNGREPAYGLSRFLPVFGDEVLPEHPLVALKKGAGADVDVLIGTNSEEMNVYFVPTGVKKKINRLLSWFFLRRSEPNAGKVLKAYESGGSKKAGEVFAETTTDLVFRAPGRRYAAAHRGRTWFYEFGWRSPALNGELGACHAIEIPFVFNTLACATGPKGLVGEDPPQELADRIQDLWVSFARNGGLSWPEYDERTRQVYQLENARAVAETDMPADRFPVPLPTA